jgi:hypothetical protein
MVLLLQSLNRGAKYSIILSLTKTVRNHFLNIMGIGHENILQFAEKILHAYI